MVIAKFFFSTILFFIAIAAPMLVEGNSLASMESIPPPEGTTVAPEIALNDLNGNLIRLSDYRGKVVLLHFWASWCLPCREEFPRIKGLWQRLADKDFVVLAIAEDSHKAAAAFVKKEDLRFPVLVDQYGSALRSYRLKAIPASYIVNREGRMEEIAVGSREWDSDGVHDLISSIINGNPRSARGELQD
jgi:peroxiredoxin